MSKFINFVKETSQACKSDVFNQYKFEIYRPIVFWISVIAVFTEISYWFTDCQICNGFSWDTLFPRLSPVFVLILFFIVNKIYNSHVVIMIMAYLVLHSCVWATIWSIVYLPDKTHAREGFIVMHLMFIAMGYIASYRQSFIGHTWLLADIVISNSFNHYECYNIMVSMCVLSIIAIECMVFFTNNGLYDRYLNKMKLEWLSYHDQLTGLYNRNIFKDESIFSKRDLNDTSWIVVLDIDFFKKVNDTYGHLEGDEVLKLLSTILLESSGSYDRLALRWGGEEFMVIIKHSSRDEVYRFADDIRKRVELIDNACCKLTISCGIASYKSDFKTTVNRADEALYLAKSSGRNCVKVYGE